MENKKKWYKTWWGILAIIFLFPIFLMAFLTRLIWKQNWKVQTRVIAIALLWGVVLVGGSLHKDTNQAAVVDTECIGPDGKRIGLNPEECEKFNNAWKNKPQETVTTSNNTTQPTTAPTNDPKPTEKHNIVVTSQIVKKVDGKYRYFFDIRNKDTRPFEGSVIISLFTSELKNPIAGDTFNTNKAIEPELGTSVYTDANTGPPSVHGANGISRFTYTVKKGNEIVNKGEGVITDKFEDVDSYDF